MAALSSLACLRVPAAAPASAGAEVALSLGVAGRAPTVLRLGFAAFACHECCYVAPKRGEADGIETTTTGQPVSMDARPQQIAVLPDDIQVISIGHVHDLTPDLRERRRHPVVVGWIG